MALLNKIKDLPRYVWSSSSLNLVCTIEQKSSEIIRGLPEVLEAWKSDDEKAIGKLERGCDVLGGVMKGSKEHMSVVKLLADNQNYYGKHKVASGSVRRARSMLNDEDSKGKEGKILLLAQAKAEFNSGDFRESLRLGKEVLFVTNEKDEPLVKGSSLTGLALSELMVYLTAVYETDDFDEGEELRIIDIFKDAVKTLKNAPEDHQSPPVVIATASAMHNLYIATSALLNLYSAKNYDLPHHIETPTDDISNTLNDFASDSFFFESLPYYHHLSQSLLASIYCTSAFHILFKNKREKAELKEGDLQAASQASQEALKICEMLKKNGCYDPILMSRSLFLLATCFARANSAVTSEGLFNSSIDLLKKQQRSASLSPLAMLSLRDTYNANAMLYDNWENRYNDAEKLRLLADDLEMSTMVESWRYKPGILSGLWFFTHSDFYL